MSCADVSVWQVMDLSLEVGVSVWQAVNMSLEVGVV